MQEMCNYSCKLYYIILIVILQSTIDLYYTVFASYQSITLIQKNKCRPIPILWIPDYTYYTIWYDTVIHRVYL